MGEEKVYSLHGNSVCGGEHLGKEIHFIFTIENRDSKIQISMMSPFV